MSISHTLSALGAALAGTVNATNDAVPAADPRVVRELLTEIGAVRAGASDVELDRALRRFQARSGLVMDGVAGPKSVHLLTRCAADLRELRELGLAA